MTPEDRPVLERLEDAVKWWNADEAEEPDVRRLFAACKAEIERLREQATELMTALDGLLAIDDVLRDSKQRERDAWNAGMGVMMKWRNAR